MASSLSQFYAPSAPLLTPTLLPPPSGASRPLADLLTFPSAPDVEAAVVPVMRLPGAELSPQPGRTLFASGRLVMAWALSGAASTWDMVRVIGQRDADRKALIRHAGAAVTDVAVWPAFAPGVPRGDSEFEVLVTADNAGVVLVTAVALLASDGSLEARALARLELPGMPGDATRVQPVGTRLVASRGDGVFTSPPLDGAFFGAGFSLCEAWLRGLAAPMALEPRAFGEDEVGCGERVAALHALGDAGLILVLVGLARGGPGDDLGPRARVRLLLVDAVSDAAAAFEPGRRRGSGRGVGAAASARGGVRRAAARGRAHEPRAAAGRVRAGRGRR